MTTPFRHGRGSATRSPVYATNGMVCAAQPLAVQAGVEALKAGGSAVDAAIVTNACLGLMEPTANGIGGDLFAIVWDPAAGKLAGLNASGRAPAGLEIHSVNPTPTGTIPIHSPFSWTVPGCVDGWAELHQRYGRLPWPGLFEPATRYAESGFPLTPVIAYEWRAGASLHKDRPGFAEVFMPGGNPPGAGQLFRNPALARSLRLVAESGREAYYRGPIAEAVVRFSEANEGFFALDDFAAHTSTWVEPISTTYRGYTVHELPPPGQGLAALQILNILEEFDLRAIGRDSPDWWHLMVEAKKLAFADRSRYYADPDFAAIPVESLLSKEYSANRADLIDPNRAALEAGPGLFADTSETTYLCAADSTGMMVSLIQSNFNGFGSGYAIPELGFGLQNRGRGFSLDPSHPNALAPRKRPFHTIIPAFLTQADVPLMAFGLMGGDMQPQGHAQVIVNLIDHAMNPQEAGDVPRFRHMGDNTPAGLTMRDGGTLNLERSVPPAIREELARRGHRLEDTDTAQFGGYQAIWRDPTTGTYLGATERRKDGCALGY